MEDNGKIRVGITHGDINGVGYEVILKAFSDPTMFELCTPIVYGSPKVAAYHRKAMDLQTAFSIIATAEEAMDGRQAKHTGMHRRRTEGGTHQADAGSRKGSFGCIGKSVGRLSRRFD